MLWRGDEHSVDVWARKQVLEILKRAWRSTVIFCIRRDSLFAVHAPQIADCGHLDPMAGFQLGGDLVQLAAAASDSNVGKRNTVISARDIVVGNRGPGDGGPTHNGGRSAKK